MATEEKWRGLAEGREGFFSSLPSVQAALKRLCRVMALGRCQTFSLLPGKKKRESKKPLSSPLSEQYEQIVIQQLLPLSHRDNEKVAEAESDCHAAASAG